MVVVNRTKQMKKVILNVPLKDLNGSVLVEGVKTVDVDGVKTQIPVSVTYGSKAVKSLGYVRTETDEDALALLALAKKINDTLLTVEPVELSLEDSEFSKVNEVISREPMIIKGQFLQMVAELN